MTSDDSMFLINPYLKSNEVEARIAATLRGAPSPLFLKALAAMFDPPRRLRPTWRATVKRRRANRPREFDFAIGMTISEAIDDRGEKFEAAIAAAMETHGISRRTAANALKFARDMRQSRQMVNETKLPPRSICRKVQKTK